MKPLSERVTQVLQEIDKQLALAEKATPAPWNYVDCTVYNALGSEVIADVSLKERAALT